MLKDIERTDTYLIQKVYYVGLEEVQPAARLRAGAPDVREVEKTVAYQIVPIKNGKLVHNSNKITRHTTLNGARSIATGCQPTLPAPKRTKAESHARKEIKREESRQLRQRMQNPTSGKRINN